eukprot:Pgem_evm1s19792
MTNVQPAMLIANKVNELYPNIKLCQSEKLGMYLVANKDLEIGEEVKVIEF